MGLMFLLAFTACQSLDYVKEKNETIQLIVKGNDNNVNYEKEQKVFYENLKNELNRRKVRYKIEENSGEWVIVLLDVPYFQGKVVKL